MLRAPDVLVIDIWGKSRKHEIEEAHVWLRALCPRTIDMTIPNQEIHSVRQDNSG